MKIFLSLILFIFLTNVMYGQIAGSTSYSLENAIIPGGNAESTVAVNDDNNLTFYKGTGNIIGQNGSHGAILSHGNTISMKVAATATITFTVCQYSKSGSTFSFADEGGIELGAVEAVSSADEETRAFAYSGTSQVITATVNSTGSVYLHAITIENAASPEVLPEGVTEVWDFGAEQFDEVSHINRLDVATINAFYPGSVVLGSTGNVLPNFSAGILGFTSGGNDRLRTTNTNLTRYDDNISNSAGYTGRIYINSSAATSRYLSINLNEDDEIAVVCSSQNGSGLLNFFNVAFPSTQTDQVSLTTEAAAYKFVAKEAGVYQMFDTQDKPSYFRVSRNSAIYSTISGTVSAPAEIPAGYGLVFTNEVGKTWDVPVESGSYSVELPTNYSYVISLSDANGFVISSGDVLGVAADATENITIEGVALNTVSGNITGLGSNLENLALVYRSVDESKIFEPTVDLNTTTGSYSVQLEPNNAYVLFAKGVNDYNLLSNSITIEGDKTMDVVFTEKPTYAITINAPDLSAEQLSAMNLTFTNLTEEGYSYKFSDVSAIVLRDGVYTIASDGLDEYPIEMGLISNLEVNGTATSKTIAFTEVTSWEFDDITASGVMAYKGMTFSNGASIRGSSNKDLVTGVGEVISVPVKVGQKVLASYYYAAAFNFPVGDDIVYKNGATATSEYVYQGTSDGFVTIHVIDGSETTGTGTSYFKKIEVLDVVAYSATITVGIDKDYQTINDALAAIALMDRVGEERVNVMIDPGNYEEMLVINLDNVTFTNASSSPSIALKDGGVNIDDNAVRITSYYGHGYNYYSMGDNQKWNSEVLRVNKENGYLSYENAGSGTTNGSYWNATVVVYANGFEVNNIIIENSFNQYVSEKESEDIVVEWTSGGKGARPTDAGNTNVQNKSFVERAAALAITNGDKMILNNCRLVGRQDVFYGGIGSRVAVYKGNMMGGADYIFGGMTAVFYKSELAMNTSEDSNDVSYITAGQQGGGDRGYLMYECRITSAIPGVDNTSVYRSKPGSFGRCWSGPTCEVLFYNTTIETSNNPSYDGKSLIVATGWATGLGGPSIRVGEYGTTELSGVDNSSNRFSGAEIAGDWGATVLTAAQTRGDGVVLAPVNFTNNGDGWDPFPELIANDPSTAVAPRIKDSSVAISAVKHEIIVSGINADSVIRVYNLQGSLVKTINTQAEVRFPMHTGCWVVKVNNVTGSKSVKVVTL